MKATRSNLYCLVGECGTRVEKPVESPSSRTVAGNDLDVWCQHKTDGNALCDILACRFWK
jgi:hypothetical protein